MLQRGGVGQLHHFRQLFSREPGGSSGHQLGDFVPFGLLVLRDIRHAHHIQLIAPLPQRVIPCGQDVPLLKGFRRSSGEMGDIAVRGDLRLKDLTDDHFFTPFLRFEGIIAKEVR